MKHGLQALRLALLAVALAATAAGAQPTGSTAPPLVGEAGRGERLYQGRCGACHSLDANRVGPLHRGLVGRRVASVPNFRYSRALAAQTFSWDGRTLDRWLANPTAMVPGTSMGYRVANAQDRADIIAYLRTQPRR